jgi:hypothetical protein
MPSCFFEAVWAEELTADNIASPIITAFSEHVLIKTILI